MNIKNEITVWEQAAIILYDKKKLTIKEITKIAKEKNLYAGKSNHPEKTFEIQIKIHSLRKDGRKRYRRSKEPYIFNSIINDENKEEWFLESDWREKIQAISYLQSERIEEIAIKLGAKKEKKIEKKLPKTINELLKLKKIISTKSDLIIDSIDGLIKKGTIILQPDFQRRDVWDKKLSSRLIESIIMDIPIPSIYLAEEKYGNLEIVDGQQRLWAIHGYINNKYFNKETRIYEQFELIGLENKFLNGLKYKDLSKKIQNKILTTTINAITILKESDPDAKFDAFQRLNQGSKVLTSQEIRNCIYRGNLNNKIKTLATNESFEKFIQKTNLRKRMEDEEIVLRFLALSEKTYRNYNSSMKKFLNRFMEENQTLMPDKLQKFEERWNKSCELTEKVFGKDFFIMKLNPYTEENTAFMKETKIFSISRFETIMYVFSLPNISKKEIIDKADCLYESFLYLCTHNKEFIEAMRFRYAKEIKRRIKIWENTVYNIILRQKTSNTFSIKLKSELLEKNNTCKICKQKIFDINDCEIDCYNYHLGGIIIPNNAQLIHRFCNNI